MFDAAGNRETGVAFGTATPDEARGSGVALTACDPITGAGASCGLGEHTISRTATDQAGNTATASVTFTVTSVPATGGTGGTGGSAGGTTTTTTPSATDPQSAPASSPSSTPAPTASTPLPTPEHPPIPAAATPEQAKAALADSAGAKALVRGVAGTLSGLKAKSKVTATIVSAGHRLRTLTVTVDAKGTAHVKLKLTAKQLAGLHGKTLTVRFAVIGADGKRHTLTQKLKVK